MPDGIDTSKLERIAFATSRNEEDRMQARWTELAVYHRPGERRPFVAESIGRTKVKGEVDFNRQRVGKTVEEVCRLFDNSRLHDEIVEQVQKWADANNLVDREPPSVQFTGDGGLRGALLWLYPAASKDASENELAKRFQYDFGVPMRTVSHALAQEREGQGLPSWCKAFIAALQHFDRDNFYKCRRV